VILVTGATGFVGRSVVRALRVADRPVRCLVREPAKAGTLEAWGCELAQGDMTDAASLRAATEGCDAVVHLVAILTGRPEDFERVMTEGTRALVEAAGVAGVRRIVLMGSLGFDSPGGEHVPYYAAKGAMEDAVRGSGIGYTILRPSFVFGPDGGALQRFARIVRYSPVIPVPGSGTQRVEPIWIDDVARAVVLALDSEESLEVDLGGPEALSWNELWQRIAKTIGARRRLVHLPVALLRPQAALFERLPNPPLTRDQLRMLELADNVVSDGGAGMERLGLRDRMPLDEQLRRALGR
jgi:NADH dehydrogenase